MKLVGSYTSPFTRKIRVMLIEKGLSHVFVNDPPADPASHILDYNPLGKVPALETDAGTLLVDSSVIAGYVETLAAAPFFLPADAREAVSVRNIEALADGVTDAGILILMERRRPAAEQSAAFIDKQRGKLERGYAALDQLAAGRQWLHGERMSLADIATACMVGWINFRFAADQLDARHPALTAWAAPVLARPSFVTTVPFA